MLAMSMMGGFGMPSESRNPYEQTLPTKPTEAQNKILRAPEKMSKKRKAILKKQSK